MRVPSPASFNAIPRPMPRELPVIRTFLLSLAITTSTVNAVQDVSPAVRGEATFSTDEERPARLRSMVQQRIGDSLSRFSLLANPQSLTVDQSAISKWHLAVGQTANT